MKRVLKITTLMAVLLFRSIAFSQSVESYAGHERIGIDLMWFKNFSNSMDERTPFLFFSRNRASVDYHGSPALFGSTNAVSYNFKNGLGIVTVGSFLNTGFTPKAGVQFYKQENDFLFFGWLVADLQHEGNIDLFGMFRYQPEVLGKWRLFSQLELFPVYNPSSEIWSITQRLRLGTKYHKLAFGAMTDLNQLGRTDFTFTSNVGGFVRYDF